MVPESERFPFNYVRGRYQLVGENIEVDAGHLLIDLGIKLTELMAHPEFKGLCRLPFDTPMATGALPKLFAPGNIVESRECFTPLRAAS